MKLSHSVNAARTLKVISVTRGVKDGVYPEELTKEKKN